MKDLYIKDTADLVLRRISDGHVVVNARMQLGGIEQTLTEERLKGGIGNQTIALIRSDKEVTLNTRNAVFNMEYLALTQGVAIEENGTATVTKFETVKVVSDAGSLEVTITGTPVANTAVFHDKDGTQEQVAVTTGVATIPVGSVAVAGDEVMISYKEQITGQIIRMDAAKFAEKYEAELHTYAYDVETESIYADVVFQFDAVVPSGAFSMNLENGTPLAPEVNFTVMNPKGKTEFGRIILKERV